MNLRKNILYPIGILSILVIISGFSLFCVNGGHYANELFPPQNFEDYKKDWEKVDSLIGLGLPKSALELTESIFIKAKKENNHPQFIKATIYKIKLSADFNEEFIEKTVVDLKNEISEAKQPAKQILHSLLADIYWRYYQANRYKFLERTTLINTPKEDIRTWDMKTLMNKIIINYYASLENPVLLKKTNLKDYQVILTEEKESKNFRPALYDFLSHRAVDFFMNDESSFVQPAYRFELDKATYFSQPEEFRKMDLETRDSLSLKFYALEILQELVDFHLNDTKPTALVDVNLKRLDFVRNNATMDGKDSLYIQSLKDFEKSVQNYHASTEVCYEIAREYYKQSRNYKPLLSDKHKWEAKAAIEKCEEALQRFPDSFGAENCQKLKQEIEKINFEITLEKENIPNKPILSLLTFKNLSKIHLRLIKMDYEKDRELRQTTTHKTELVKKYLKFESIYEWEQSLPNDGDYQQHSAEIKLPSSLSGFYILLASESADFDPGKNIMSHQSFWVTNIGYISQTTPKSGYRFYTLNRETGNAKKGVHVKLYYRHYDYHQREYQYNEGGTFISGEDGYFEIPALDLNAKPNSFFLEFSDQGDRFITEDRFYHSVYSPREDRKITTTFFFTDRAIYRPGQTVYFKGIVLEKYKNTHEIKPGHKTTIEFLDVNYQKISEIEVVANEYGSFNGSFTAPQGGLNGRMTIKNQTGSKSILVEEYKRPKFEVTFNPVEGSYKLGEEVEISGIAKAFAGNSISNAQVKYRIARETYYPWRFGFFGFYPEKATLEITNGTTITNESGNFTIVFEAIPDHSIPKKFNPAFNYTIYTDVTDINNETQSATTHVHVGYKALTIKLGIGEVENIDDFQSFSLQTTNLNGQALAASGKIKISLLEEPERLLREQLWQNPDVYVIDREAFVTDFPHDNYKNENQPDELKVKSVITEIDFNTPTDSIISLKDINKWQPGRYSVIVNTKDEYGTDVELKKYFSLFSEKGKTAPVKELNWFHVLKSKCEPGESVKFILGTKDKNLHVLYEVAHKEKVLSTRWIKLNSEQQLIEIPVTENYRGGFKVNLLFVKHNRSFNNSFSIDVPYTNKKLDFEFSSFRNKLEPGTKEEWAIKIKGHKGESLAAELLTSMYDASLDKFQHHAWGFNILTHFYQNITWTARNSFNNTSISKLITNRVGGYAPSYRSYDRLNWFGFNYFPGAPYMQKRIGLTMDGIPATAGGEMDNRDMAFEGDAGINESITAEDEIGEGKASPEMEMVSGAQVRRDFRETAFFYPALRTDENGNVIIRFTVPESLTSWKLMGLAHSKDLKYGQFTKEVITQKELMVVPNPPRFFRKGDQMKFAAKVTNLSEKEINGDALLQFFDTRTMEEITDKILSSNTSQHFELDKEASQNLNWDINIPENFDIISYRIIAKSDDFSDGEEKPIPVLSNRMLVTESLPLPVKGDETKEFTFTKLVNSKPSNETGKGLVHHKLSLEFSSNPAWYAVQALPYVMESTHESAESVFYRFYANTIASYLVNSNPKIKQVFDTWKNFSADALLSNLEKNQELKSLILNETPWVRDAQNETERKQRIAILFDINKMADEQSASLRKLVQKQSPGGGWPWFKGMPDNRYITQLIVNGFGHLKQIGVFDAWENDQTKAMLSKALRYLDYMIKEDHERLIRNDVDLSSNHLGNIQIQYLYGRSYFIDQSPVSKSNLPAFEYYFKQAKDFWQKQGNFQKGMIALALYRLEEGLTPSQIMASIKEHALYSEEMGMYWRDNRGGYYWHEAPIETQALLIEAFFEVSKDNQPVEQMKIWLLKQKQTQDWKTSKATAEAVYALLLRGSDWLANSKLAQITIGNTKIDPLALEDTKVEAGTGYFKTSWPGSEIKPEMGNITVVNENPSIAWGAVYWQYFEDLENITFAETPLKLEKKLFLEENTDAGPVLKPIKNGGAIKSGNKIIVRIELRVDRDMEFVHMKDMLAAAFEPVNVLSGYRYQDGLGYYESTLDASTNFFFDYLR
ncbi:MAG: hypothetical protein K8S16_05405, partial [Bacteroidales bacterium]|nr:hypothetical protein [Bacteroidales bacterium]